MIRIVLAGFFSLVFPGIGQLYNRQWIKGILFILVELGILYLAPAELGFVMIYRLIWLFSIIDASVVSYLVYKGKKEIQVFRGWRAALVVGLSMLIILPIALLPTFLPQIIFIKAIAQQTVEVGGSDEQLEEEKQLYKEYLEETYGGSFILGDAEYNSNYEHYLVEAYPEANPDIVFGVYQDRNENIKNSYIDNLWEIEAFKEISPIIENLYANIWQYKVDVAIKAGLKEQILSENNQVIGFNEGKSKYPENYNYWVELLVFEEFDLDTELDKLFEIISYFKDAEIQVTSFEVSYYDEILLDKEGNYIEPSSEYFEYNTHFISVNKDEIVKIDSADDLEKHIIKLN